MGHDPAASPDRGQPATAPWRLALVSIFQYVEGLSDRQAAEAVRQVNRLEMIGETLRAALNALAGIAPDWLRGQVAPDWFERYSAQPQQSC